jgi:hypothetical protein
MIEHKLVCGCHANTGQAISALRMKHRFTPRCRNTKLLPGISLIVLFLFGIPSGVFATQRYFAHEAVEDSHGVIAPWYRGLNGQLDYRARIAAKTMKRYPWTVSSKTSFAAPDYLHHGRLTARKTSTEGAAKRTHPRRKPNGHHQPNSEPWFSAVPL